VTTSENQQHPAGFPGVLPCAVAEAIEQGATDGLPVASPDGLDLDRALGWSVVADMVIARSC
jgi:hypothetical protein